VALAAVVAWALPARATTPLPPRINGLLVTGTTVSVDRSDRMRATLDLKTGRILKLGESGEAPREPLTPGCDASRTSVCAFPEGVLTVKGTHEGTVLAWRDGKGGWRALTRSAAPEHIWSAGGALFVAGGTLSGASIECLDAARGTPRWLYAYEGAPRGRVVPGAFGTVPLDGDPEAAARAPYPGAVVRDPGR
jgi:hypothetical protein